MTSVAEALSGDPNLSEMTCGPDVVAWNSPGILTSGPCWFGEDQRYLLLQLPMAV